MSRLLRYPITTVEERRGNERKFRSSTAGGCSAWARRRAMALAFQDVFSALHEPTNEIAHRTRHQVRLVGALEVLKPKPPPARRPFLSLAHV